MQNYQIVPINVDGVFQYRVDAGGIEGGSKIFKGDGALERAQHYAAGLGVRRVAH